MPDRPNYRELDGCWNCEHVHRWISFTLDTLHCNKNKDRPITCDETAEPSAGDDLCLKWGDQSQEDRDSFACQHDCEVKDNFDLWTHENEVSSHGICDDHPSEQTETEQSRGDES